MVKGRAHNKKNKDYILLERRMRVARLYCEGRTQSEIAKAVGIGMGTVSEDLAKIREYWLSLMMVDFDERKSTELAKIDHLEETAWRAWRRSVRPAQTRHVLVERGVRVVQERDKNGQPIKGKAPISKMLPVREVDDTTEKTQAGDPRFLTIIRDCIQDRLKLMGLLEEKAATNVYLDFGTILQQKKQELEHHQGDVIENLIANVGEGGVQTNGQHQSQQPSEDTQQDGGTGLGPMGQREEPGSPG